MTLDEQLCFALYDASRAIVGRYRAGLEELGLTYTQFLVLMLLWQRSPQPLGELGEALHLDSGTLSPLLKRLEAHGNVTRRRGTLDERIVEIGITEEGRALRERAVVVMRQVEAATGMATERIDALRAELQELVVHLRAEGEPELTA